MKQMNFVPLAMMQWAGNKHKERENMEQYITIIATIYVVLSPIYLVLHSLKAGQTQRQIDELLKKIGETREKTNALALLDMLIQGLSRSNHGVIRSFHILILSGTWLYLV